MPRFYFDIDKGQKLVVDPVGFDHADRRAAKNEAIRMLGRIAVGLPPGVNQRVLSARIREGDRVVFRGTLSLDEDWRE